MSDIPFSQRHGLTGPPVGTLVRGDAPVGLRTKLIEVLTSMKLNSLGSDFDGIKLRSLFLQVMNRRPTVDLSSLLNGYNAFEESKQLLYECEWFQFYEIVEELSQLLRKEDARARVPPSAGRFADTMNEAFARWSIGWQLVGGKVIIRGDDAFERTLTVAGQELGNRPTARTRIREAINDLSRRPTPDLPGAVFHAFAAMECIIGDIEYTPEEIRTNTHHTFGSFLAKHPDLFPGEDFKEAFRLLWKYANNEGSRHGKEGMEPATDEAELIVSLAASLVTYLNRKHPK